MSISAIFLGGGVFVLGQEQDRLGGGFHTLESFIGEIAFLNLWPQMMSDDEILNLSQSCGHPEDALINWPAFLAGKTGDVRKETVHFCEGNIFITSLPKWLNKK